MMTRLFVLLILLLSASAARADAVADGKTLFEQECLPCHDSRGTGTIMLGKRLGADHALLAARRDLNAPYIKAVLRNGIGSMTWYRQTEITDAQADAIAAYLTRNNGQTP